MRSYSNFSVRDLLDAFSSTAPAPGGGAAAALTGAIGVSLLLMAAGIRAARPGESTDSAELAVVAGASCAKADAAPASTRMLPTT